jgi:hypothetical protein
MQGCGHRVSRPVRQRVPARKPTCEWLESLHVWTGTPIACSWLAPEHPPDAAFVAQGRAATLCAVTHSASIPEARLCQYSISLVRTGRLAAGISISPRPANSSATSKRWVHARTLYSSMLRGVQQRAVRLQQLGVPCPGTSDGRACSRCVHAQCTASEGTPQASQAKPRACSSSSLCAVPHPCPLALPNADALCAWLPWCLR